MHLMTMFEMIFTWMVFWDFSFRYTALGGIIDDDVLDISCSYINTLQFLAIQF